MRLRADQIGTQVTCPKCNATFMVGRPGAQPTAATSMGDDDAYEPEIPLKRSSIVPDEQAPDAVPPPPPAQYDADWENVVPQREPPHVRPLQMEPDYLEAAEAKGLLRREVVVHPPKWTFFSGVFLFPWQGPNIGRWAAMSFGLSISGAMSYGALKTVGLLSGYLTDVDFGGLFLMIFAIIMLLAAASYSAACVWSAIQDTADGHDRVLESSMPEWDQWLFTLLGMVMLWAASASIGYPLSLIREIGIAGIFGSSMLVFPVLLLSSMECGSSILPYSPPVLATLRRLWWGWLVFYVLTALLLVGFFAPLVRGLATAPYATLLAAGPVAAAILLVYARLLGRVAWRTSGMPPAVSEDANAPGKFSKRGRRRRRQIWVEIPEHLGGPDNLLSRSQGDKRG